MELEENIFVRPEFKDVYNRIVKNNKLQSYLYKVGALMTVDDYYKVYDIPSKTNKYELKAEKFVEEVNENTLTNLTNLLLDNSDTIEKKSVVELVSSNFLFDDIRNVLGFSQELKLDVSFYSEFFYLYKFSFVDNFFQNNWEHFVPEVDSESINDNAIAKSFVDALMIEFDKLNNIINNVKDFKSYKDIPYDYINYLSQLLGFEQKNLGLTKKYEEEIRVISANIIDIYRIRGTISSFKLLFNFLGFDVEINQYYFDRRYRFNDKGENRKTLAYEMDDYRYYLTVNNPADNIFENFPITETVSESDFIKPLGFENFSKLVKRYGLDCVLGYSDMYEYKGEEKIDIIVDENGRSKREITEIKSFIEDDGTRVCKGELHEYKGPKYTYFLTNIVDIIPRFINKSGNFNLEHTTVLSKLLEFLTPEFWKKHFVVNVKLSESIDDGLYDRITVNGHKETEETPKHADQYVEGFRMLDSEDWLCRDSTDVNLLKDDKESKRVNEAINNEIKERLLIQVDGDRYIRIRDNTPLIPLIDIDRRDINNIKYYIKKGDKKEVSKTTIVKTKKSDNDDDNEMYCIEDLTMSGGEPLSKYLYTNSIGETKENRPKNSDSQKTKYDALTREIGGNTINIMNSTSGAGAMMKFEEGYNSSEIYPYWKRTRNDIVKDSEGHQWVPPISGTAGYYSARLSYPKNLDYYWNSKPITKFNSLEGDSIRKNFLKINEDTKQLIDYYYDVKADGNNTEINVLKKVFNEKINNNSANNKIVSVQSGFWRKKSNIYVIQNENDEKKLKNNLGEKACYELLEVFVEKHNVINFDYINNALLVGEYVIDNNGEHQNEYYDITNDCYKYCADLIGETQVKKYSLKKYDNGNGIYKDTYFTSLLNVTIDAGNYLLQKKVIDNKVPPYYEAYEYVIPKAAKEEIGKYEIRPYASYIEVVDEKKVLKFLDDYANANDLKNLNLNEYRYIPTLLNGIRAVNRFPKLANQKSIVKTDKYIDVKKWVRNNYYKGSLSLPYAVSIKNDSFATSVITSQPFGYKGLVLKEELKEDKKSYYINCVDLLGGVTKENGTNKITIEKNKLLAKNVTSDNEETLKEKILRIEQEKLGYGEFYFRYEEEEDNKTNNIDKNSINNVNKEEKEKFLKDLILKRSKNIITKNSLQKNKRVYYDGNIYKVVSNSALYFENANNIILDKIVNEKKVVTKYLPVEGTSSEDLGLTPGIEGENYILNEKGELIPKQSLKEFTCIFDQKTVYTPESNDRINLFFGIKKINLKGNIQKVTEDGVEKIYLYSYDRRYNGVTEDDDNDNYIMKNTKRLVKWNILNIEKDNTVDNTTFDNVYITRPVKEKTDRLFENYKNNPDFIKNVLTDMLGETAMLKRTTKYIEKRQGD